MKIAPLAAVSLCACLVGAGALASAQRPSVFLSIHLAQHRASGAAEGAKRLSQSLPEQALEIERAIKLRDTTARAALTLKSKSTRRQASWEHAYKTLKRQRLWRAPGQADDALALLALAEGRVHQEMVRDYDVLETNRLQGQRVWSLVQQRGATVVQMAQHTATAHTARSEEALAKANAKRASAKQVRADLKSTQAKLQASLDGLLKNPTPKDFHRLKGALIPPVPKRPLFGFGPRKQAKTTTYIRHAGLTYDVPVGTRVRATGPGIVAFAGWFEGYGQMVILDHGGGYHSVYAHLSSVSVKRGAKLKRNDTLGQSGDTGSLEGAKLYFEMRKKGFAIDPSPWFVSKRR